MKTNVQITFDDLTPGFYFFWQKDIRKENPDDDPALCLKVNADDYLVLLACAIYTADANMRTSAVIFHSRTKS